MLTVQFIFRGGDGARPQRKTITFYSDHLLGKIFLLVVRGASALGSDQGWSKGSSTLALSSPELARLSLSGATLRLYVEVKSCPAGERSV